MEDQTKRETDERDFDLVRQQVIELSIKELLEIGIDIENNKIKETEIPKFMSAIILRLWQDKGDFVSRETIANIRQTFLRDPSKSRNIEPELSANFTRMDKILRNNAIPITIFRQLGKVMLIKH